MGGQAQSTEEQANPPVIPSQGMPSSITPVMTPSFNGGPPKVDPLSYSDPTNMPDPLIEALKWLVGSSAPKNAPKR